MIHKAKLETLLTAEYQDNECRLALDLSTEHRLRIYPRSIHAVDGAFLLVAREDGEKSLYVVGLNGSRTMVHEIDGEGLHDLDVEPGITVRRCPMSQDNAAVVRRKLDFTRPTLLGLESSFGLGDRLGLANPAHLRAVAGSGFRPVLAQQSIRELERTERSPQEVLDAATWAVLQEGFHDGFGADADHLKTTADIDRMVRAGFTMFTFDSGDYVIHEAGSLSKEELLERAMGLPWERLGDRLETFMERYAEQRFELGSGLVLEPTRWQVLRALVKYGAALAHTSDLFQHLKRSHPHHPSEVEMSVDETETPTTPFEHLMIARELRRLGVRWVSLAPRFVGEVEKGIDYRGDLETFRREYLKHLAIAEAYGPYKISIHSGSDKFGIYQVIGGLGRGSVHVKTAGTSYLEALRTLATCEPELLYEIIDFSREHFEEERRTYHVSANLKRVPPASEIDKGQLQGLFAQEDARQVLHVAFGRVLTARNADGGYRFRERILTCLRRNEEVHYRNIEAHFRRHVAPFLEVERGVEGGAGCVYPEEGG